MRRIVWNLLLAMLLSVSFVTVAQAECIEVKNDKMTDPNNPSSNTVIAYRGFCQSEYFGAVFDIKADMEIQKIRLLVSGDNKTIMDGATLKMIIYEDTGQKTPGRELVGETPYAISPGGITSAKPHWFEIPDVGLKLKKGQKIRVVFGHAVISCTPTSSHPCPKVCNWWSATTDTGPRTDGRNLTYYPHMPFDCPDLKLSSNKEWVYWKDMPAKCQPKGNLILRLYGYSGSGKDCKGGGSATVCQAGATQKCVCPGGGDGSQTCNGLGTAWGECKCKSEKVCDPGTARPCKCSDGSDKIQSCNDQGTGYKACPCTGGGQDPVLTSLNPKEGSPDKTTQVTILGNNFQQGIKFLLDTTELTNVQLNGNNAATAVVPKGMEVKKYDLIARNPDGKEAKLSSAFEIKAGKTARPVVEKITPSAGANNDDVDITILGQNFVDGADVMIGKIRINDVKVRGESTITATVPKGLAAGKFDVVVINPDKQEGTLGNGYEIIDAGCACQTTQFKDGLTPLFSAALLLLFIGFQRRRRA